VKKIAEKPVFSAISGKLICSPKCCDHAKLNTCMRIDEVIRAKTPEEQRIAALKANRDRAAQALKAERNRQRMTRAQRQLAKAQQANRSFTKPISV
jgi:hypothetical protein